VTISSDCSFDCSSRPGPKPLQHRARPTPSACGRRKRGGRRALRMQCGDRAGKRALLRQTRSFAVCAWSGLRSSPPALLRR